MSNPERVLMHAWVALEREVELVAVEKKRARIIRWQSVTLDLDQHRLCVDDMPVSASRAEFGLLHLLISRRNLPMTKEFIMSWLFGHEHGRDLRQVDMFVARLRQSLAAFGLADLIQAIGGRGYAVLDDDRDAAPLAGAQPSGWEMAAAAG